MGSVRAYLKMSKELASFVEEYLSPAKLRDNYLKLSVEEQKALLNHYVSDGRCEVLKDKPLLYDQIISFMADAASVPTSHVKIIGSFKLGFCSGEDFGRKFDKYRDVDMSIFDERLFETLVHEYEEWSDAYSIGTCIPNNECEKIFWNDNKRILARKISEGFIDTYRLPNRPVCPTIMKLHNSAAPNRTQTNGVL